MSDLSPKSQNLGVSLLPMTSTDDPKFNLQTIINALNKIPKTTRILCLPENSLFLNLDKTPIPKEKAFHKNSPEILKLSEEAQKRNVYIHMGGIAWLKEDGKVYNEALLLTPEGEIQETYEKLHLFDVQLGGSLDICESNSFNAGSRLNTFTIDGWKFATCICYDLRFPEIFLHYVINEGVDIFLVPAAFTTKTGKTHWKPLLTARAIETQSFVLAAAQVGYHRDLERTKLRKSWGQSLIIGPWGQIQQETSSFEDFLDSSLTEHDPINSVLRREDIESYKRSIPVAQHRKFHVELKKK